MASSDGGPAAPRLRELLTPVVEAGGLDLEDVEVSRAGSRSVVRVLVDRDGGVTLDDVAEVSRAVSEALDAVEVDEPSLLAGATGGYVLEVGSPGVDRPLTAPRHWRRAEGRLVEVALAAGGSVTGRVASAEDDASGAAVLDVDGSERRVAYDEILRALVQVEFIRPGAEEDA